MTLADKAKNKSQELKGRAKELAGKATGDEDLRAEGEVDQAKGNLKQAGLPSYPRSLGSAGSVPCSRSAGVIEAESGG
jgi:uncharacterized protein YjbJ (UPF0337 family)